MKERTFVLFSVDELPRYGLENCRIKRTFVLFLVAVVLSGVGSAVGRVEAQPAAQVAPGATTVLVPPQGGTADVPVRFSSNVLLTFPSPLAPRVVQSSSDWEVRDFAEGVVARAVTANAQPTTLALATRDGVLKVNITLRLVPETAAGLTLVRFQSATAEEAFEAAVAAEVARRTGPIEAELARARAGLEETIRERVDRRIAAAVRSRLEVRRVKAHARNRANVIVHGQRVVRVGADAYLLAEIENRSDAAYRIAAVQVLDRSGTDRAAAAVLAGGDGGRATRDVETAVLGVVPAGASGFVTIVIRDVDALAGQAVRLVIAEPGGANRVTVERGLRF